MAMIRTLLALVAATGPLLATAAADAGPFREVRVTGFHSDEPEACKAADVNVDHRRAAIFFQRAQKVSYRVIHDRYNTFPCWAQGSLTFRGKACTWRLNAGLYATLHCSGMRTAYYGCAACQDLLTPPRRP